MSEMMIGALAGVAACLGLGWLVHAALREINALRGRVAALEERGAKLHTHKTAAGIEDALAVSLDLQRYAAELRFELDALNMRCAQQQEILRKVRQGPHAYDLERSAGKRPGHSIKNNGGEHDEQS